MTAPILANATATNITSSSATLGADVTSDGGDAITGRGVVFALTSTNPHPTIGAGVTDLSATGTTGAFVVEATGLQAGMMYSFAAYAINSTGTTYTSPSSTFTTLAAPTVTSLTATAITATSATLVGNVTNDGGAVVTARGVVFALTSTNPNPTIGGTGATDVATTGTTGVFAVNATDLEAGATYSYAAYAANSVGTTYTNPVSTFTTEAAATLAEDAGGVRETVGSGLKNIVTYVVAALIAVTGYYMWRTPVATNATEFNRGFITVLFSAGAIAIAVLLAITAIQSDAPNFRERFDKGKEVLTVLIGIFGTIMGFYFGTAVNPIAEPVKLALTATPEAFDLTKEAPPVNIKVSIKQIGGKFTGNVQLSVTPRNGLTTEFNTDTIKSTDGGTEVDLKVSATKDAQIGTYALRIIGTPDSGGTVIPVEIRVKVLGP